MNTSCCDNINRKAISFEEARTHILSQASAITDTESVPISQALGRILAQPVQAIGDVPPLDNSAMDGYAVRWQECGQPPTMLPISQRITAGSIGNPLETGTAARIFTGAPIPPGADSVVMQEMTETEDGKVTIQQAPTEGQNIRRAGEDICRGNTVLEQGTRLRAQELGQAASAGAGHVTVYRRLRVALLSTGDELAEPGTPLKPGQIYNSNRYSLMGLLQDLGCEIISQGFVQDTLAATKQALEEMAEKADLILTTGGVSVGEEDHIRAAMEALGEVGLWRIAIKPGKPLAFGHINNTPILGLPGNPVSTFVTFGLFARPFILKQNGMINVIPRNPSVTADFTWDKPGARLEFLRARINESGTVSIFPHQGSGVLSSACWADGLVEIPPKTPIKPGDRVVYHPFAASYG